MENNNINDNEIVAHVYKECTQFVRHYSNLRFVILTVFLTINSAFFITYTKYQADGFNLQQDIAILGIFVTVIFAVFEFAVAFNVGKYYTYGKNISELFLKHLQIAKLLMGCQISPHCLLGLL